MVQSLHGKVCLVTGANRGIGKATALGLARAGARVVMVCRHRNSAEAAAREIDRAASRGATDVIIADLSSQRAVREAAAEFVRRYDRLHVLINNAAVITRRRMLTVDGAETQLAVNHLAPFLFTNLLVGVLRETGIARVVNVSSDAHYAGTIDFDDLHGTGEYSAGRAYAQSKLANVLFTREFARRLAGSGVTTHALHPGVIATGLLAAFLRLPRPLEPLLRLFFPGPARGATTSLYAATSLELEGVSGLYLRNCAPRPPSRRAQDDQVARRLWAVSAQVVGVAD